MKQEELCNNPTLLLKCIASLTSNHSILVPKINPLYFNVSICVYRAYTVSFIFDTHLKMF